VIAGVRESARQRRSQLPIAAASVAILVWSIGPLLVRGVGTSYPTVVFYRLLTATPVMVAMAYLTGGRLSIALLRRTWRPSLLFIGALISSFGSFIYTSIANATLIGALTPALVLMVSAKIAAERRTRLQVICAAVGLVGISIVIIGSGHTSGASLKGDLFALVNLLLWATYLFEVKKVRGEGVHAGAYLAAVFTWSLAFATPWVLIVSDDLGAVHGTDWLLFAGMVIGPGLLGHGLMTWAQREVDVNVVALLGLASPVLSSVLAWVVHDQRLTHAQIAGAAIVFLSLLVLLREQIALAGQTEAAEV
jgi:drug/metabolite transporter (DMT)-like permease